MNGYLVALMINPIHNMLNLDFQGHASLFSILPILSIYWLLPVS